jgi:hypothetical protein
MIIKALEILRIIGCMAGIFLAYYYGDTQQEVLHIMAPITIFFIAGLSGIEGLAFPTAASEAAGFESGSNYQRQSAFSFLSLSIISLLVYLANWGVMADLTIVFTFLLVFTLSASNHAYQIIVEKNYKWKNMNRPFLTIALISAYWWPIAGSLNI